ncbi:MAG: OmpH family outer membrane protein [Bacteroidetes bacterium]|nr:OmpH family outer membrane protein [Bacteroidota bacterium]
MRTLLVALFCGFMITAQAQTTDHPVQKIGYAESDYILSQLPEFKKIDSELKTHGSQLENQMKAKYDDYQTKLKAYQGMPATTPDAIRADKERELAALQENIQKFQQDAQSSYQKKQADLMDPIYKKIGKAIEDVAKENGFSFIINPQLANGGDILLFSDEKFNISDLVLKKLGVTPAPPTPAPTKP